MKPNIGDTKVDKILTQYSIMYRNANYINELILPVLKVIEKSGKFAIYGKDNLRPYTGGIYRAPGTRAHTVDYSVSQGTYMCNEKALEKLVPDEYVINTDDPYDPRRDAVAVIMDNIAVNQELALSTTLADATVITQNTTLTGTDQWSDKTNSDPFADIETAIDAVRTATGKRPNTMVLGYDAYQALKSHPDVREQLKYTNGGQFSEEAVVAFIKSYWKLENVFIGDAVYNSADDGQTDSLTSVWGAHCWLMYRASRPSMMMPTFGLTLQDIPTKVDSYREEGNVSDVFRVRKSYDQNIHDATLCYAIYSVS